MIPVIACSLSPSETFLLPISNPLACPRASLFNLLSMAVSDILTVPVHAAEAGMQLRRVASDGDALIPARWHPLRRLVAAGASVLRVIRADADVAARGALCAHQRQIRVRRTRGSTQAGSLLGRGPGLGVD